MEMSISSTVSTITPSKNKSTETREFTVFDNLDSRKGIEGEYTTSDQSQLYEKCGYLSDIIWEETVGQLITVFRVFEEMVQKYRIDINTPLKNIDPQHFPFPGSWNEFFNLMGNSRYNQWVSMQAFIKEHQSATIREVLVKLNKKNPPKSIYNIVWNDNDKRMDLRRIVDYTPTSITDLDRESERNKLFKSANILLSLG